MTFGWVIGYVDNDIFIKGWYPEVIIYLVKDDIYRW